LAGLKFSKKGTTFGLTFRVGNNIGPAIDYGSDKAVTKANGLSLHPYWELKKQLRRPLDAGRVATSAALAANRTRCSARTLDSSADAAAARHVRLLVDRGLRFGHVGDFDHFAVGLPGEPTCPTARRCRSSPARPSGRCRANHVHLPCCAPFSYEPSDRF